MDKETVHDAGLAIEFDTEPMPNRACSAITAGKIAAANLLDCAVNAAQRRGDAFGILPKFLKGHAPARFHVGCDSHRPLQHRLNLDLRDTHRRLAWHAAVVLFADEPPPLVDARIAEAMQLVTGQRRHPGDIEVVVFRYRHGTQAVSQVEPAEQLHAPRIGDVHLGETRGGLVAFDEHAADAVARQLTSQRHSTGPPPAISTGTDFMADGAIRR